MADLDLNALRTTLATHLGRWQADTTAVSLLSDDQRLARLGAQPPAGARSLAEREQQAKSAFASRSFGAPAAELPAAVDWRNTAQGSYLGSVRDQGGCGSCVAFGCVAAIEGSSRVAAKKPSLGVDLSEAHLFFCHGGDEGRNCNTGWWPSQALEAVKSKGIVDEACFPYVAGEHACRPGADAAQRNRKIKGWKSLTTIAQMQAWIAEKGPVVACFTVYEDFYLYRSGVYHHLAGKSLGGHCVCVVGYSNADQAWIARNSWGTGFGEAGYFRIAFGEVGIDAEMWGVEVDAAPVVDDGVKLDNAFITGLWVNVDAKQAQCYVDKVGWRKLPNGDILTTAAAAKAGKSRCTLLIKGDTVTELYAL